MQNDTSADEASPEDRTSLVNMERRIYERFRDLEHDAQKLRRRIRSLTLGLVVAVAAIAVIGLSPTLSEGSAEVTADAIRAQRVVLIDANGQTRGEWSVDEQGNTRFNMLDQQRRQRLSLSVLEGGYPGLSLTNAAGQRRVALGLLPDETTSLVFADGSGVPRAVLGLTRGESANLVFADGGGVSRLGLGLDRDGTGSMMLPEEEAEVPEG